MRIAPGPDASSISVQGYVGEIVVENRGTGTTEHFPIFIASDGRRFTLNGSGAIGLLPGDALLVTGKADGRSMFPQAVDFVAPGSVPEKPAPTTSLEGTLRLGHADNFDGTPSEFFFAVVTDDGRQVRVALATMLGVLENGMRVSVVGSMVAGNEMAADRIVILAPPGAKTNGGVALAAATVTTSYLVIPIKFPTNAAAPFSYGADPFTPASLDSAVFAALPTKSVNEYYKEASYGQQALSGVVADNGSGGFLLANQVVPPATPCDIAVIAAAADAAATARGYNLNNYTGRLYVFNNVSGCPWSGLAYIDWPRAYSNSTTNLLVIAHELGHNFGLLHAASLDCGTGVVGGACSSSEYGDPFGMMGNQRAMHFNAAQKADLNWLPAGSVANHGSGSATYTLAPIELPGGTTYAVKVPAAANRTYWIEYRQPIGFDSGLSAFPNSGAQIRVAAPFDSVCSGCADDTEFLDMTPATGAFTDGTLLAGQTYTDSTYNVSITVTSATPTALTVQVTTSGAAANSPVLQSASSRKTHGSAGTFDLVLSLATTSPSTEPRMGPSQTLVLTFNKAITGATVAVTEGTATAGAPTFSGNNVIVGLAGVTNQQYVTVVLTNVASADGGTGGTATVRVGFLLGDVNQNRVVTLSDAGLVNGRLAQTVTASNFQMDINASGTLSLSDKGLSTAQLTKALPAP